MSKKLVLLLVVLSSLDAMFTLIEGGASVEANPAMLALMDLLFVFWLWKTIGVGLCAFVLHKCGALWALLWCTVIYTFLLCWHLVVLIVR